jgi:REP element-mobilizing transposase RayT
MGSDTVLQTKKKNGVRSFIIISNCGILKFMARPLRIELAGGLYHVTSRGDRRENIYDSDKDRIEWLSILGKVCDRFNWRCHAYCLMDNHYHFVVETVEGNLSKGMRQLNGVYTQYFNREYNRVGHVFQGRFKGILVERDSYLMELSRYVVLNPVRAGMVNQAEDWTWSSYLATQGKVKKPVWLETDWILGQFSSNRETAVMLYNNFVREGVGLPAIWEGLRKQIYMGSDQFIDSMLQVIAKDKKTLADIPQLQRRKLPKSLDEYCNQENSRNEAIRAAFNSGGYTMKQIGEYFKLHYTSISRIVKQGVI